MTTAPSPETFAVKDCAMIAIATGQQAHTLAELRDRLLDISADSIYYHFWGGLLQPRFEEREYNNDFASWAYRGLHDAPLAERLAVIDPSDNPDLEDLRQRLLEVIEVRMDEPSYLPWGPGTHPFEFMRSQLVVFDTRRRVETPRELGAVLSNLSATSIFYHFIDARRRIPPHVDDFRSWLATWGPGYEEACARIAAIDPYFGTLTELRSRLAAAFTGEMHGEGGMSALLESYVGTVGRDVVDHLQQLARPLAGMKVLHVNSTRVGGGVAEILEKLVPLTRELGIDTDWLVINGESAFYQCTKGMHNGLQGNAVSIPGTLLHAYEETNAVNADRLRPALEAADIVFIHDPQPAALIQHCARRRGKWVWRCHIDVSHPYRPVWKYLRRYVVQYDASVFSLARYAQPLPHPEYIIPPSIDPLSEKNMELPEQEVHAVHETFGLDAARPMILQVSRYDRFKDPVGVIQAYRIAKRYVPDLQLVLAGGGASDDPEGEAVLAEVREAAGTDPDCKVLLLPPDAHRTINALQRAADIVLQKSLREGFGLTVTEAMWKGKPVIGGDTGGIRLQVVNHHTGFLVNTPEGAALRIRYLLQERDKMRDMGTKARRFVLENFLLTRQLREYLTLMVGLIHAAEYRIELG